ncbi:hypothetical protein [Plantactinospora sp. GCM10030261]|uniref:YqeB family protein n=1 Tax=Plantactinospora sp. GCM10030261 TaxID=3273420 RepID=UPI003616E8A7
MRRGSGDPSASGAPVVVTEPVSDLVVMWGGFPVAGAALGWLLTVVAGWAVDARWVPWRGLFRMVDGLPDPQATIGLVIVGAVLGLAVATIGTVERLAITVDRFAVTVSRSGRRAAYDRADIRQGFLDGRRFVLLGTDGTELVREKGDLPGDRLATAFAVHGYRWTDADPHAAAYRRWVPGGAGLPPGADAVLRARQRALDRGHADDAAELRSELGRLGVVVREENKRQYWRPSRP